jgi:peptidoglycan/xylan/chitin deacetylase (PgdA/CDA1 family)
VLIYHRVGGGTPDERDLALDDFAAQMRLLAEGHEVVSLDAALDALDAGDDRPTVVLTFDDGFADLVDPALPVLAEHRLPFTVYLATEYLGREMHWDGSTASAPGPALSWDDVETLVGSGLCTIGNHTHGHVRPEVVTEADVDQCSEAIAPRIGVAPRHFAYPWGIPVPALEPALRARFRSAVTGDLGINLPGVDPLRLRRVPVRGSDPVEFFAAKLSGRLGPERAYGAVVTMAKKLGASA